MKLSIKYGNTTHDIFVNPTESVLDLKRRIEALTGVSVENQKLIPKVDNKGLDSTLADSGIKETTKIMVIGTPTSKIEAFKKSEEKQLQFLENRKVFMETMKVSPTKNVDASTANEYTFHAMEVLESFEDSAKARTILMRVKKDPAIIHIMKRNQWSIGLLSELHPHEDRTILGYNMNKGQKIALRLRTEELDAFRPYDMIRDVLLHELTHMYISQFLITGFILNITEISTL
jgi:hypothetical protein